MSDEVYITNANYKRVVKEMRAENDYHFTSIANWGHDCGYMILEDKSLVMVKRENTDSVFCVMFSVNMKDIVRSIYKKIEAHDSWSYSHAEQTPCYHGDKDCESLHSPYKAYYIPDPIQNLAIDEERENGLEAGSQIINEYRQLWKKLEKEFTEKNEKNPCLSNDFFEFMANRINLHYKLDPPIRSIDIKERGNSGALEVMDNRSANEINESILEKIEVLLQYVNGNSNLFPSKNELFCLVHNPTNTISEMSAMGVKKVLDEIHRQKEEIVEELKELYMRLFIPELDFEKPLLLSLGFGPCKKCLNGVIFGEEIEIDF